MLALQWTLFVVYISCTCISHSQDYVYEDVLLTYQGDFIKTLDGQNYEIWANFDATSEEPDSTDGPDTVTTDSAETFSSPALEATTREDSGTEAPTSPALEATTREDSGTEAPTSPALGATTREDSGTEAPTSPTIEVTTREDSGTEAPTSPAIEVTTREDSGTEPPTSLALETTTSEESGTGEPTSPALEVTTREDSGTEQPTSESPSFTTIMSNSCGDGFFGHDCALRCNCWDPLEACNKLAGDCSSQCFPGWTGSGCLTEIRDGELSIVVALATLFSLLLCVCIIQSGYFFIILPRKTISRRRPSGGVGGPTDNMGFEFSEMASASNAAYQALE